MEVLHTLHMDLCRPMRVQTFNGKKYILVIVDDYSRFTWFKFLRSKDETPVFVIKFLKQWYVLFYTYLLPCMYIKEIDKIKAKTDKHEHGNGMSAQEPGVSCKGTDIQKKAKNKQSRARDGKDQVKSKSKSVKAKSQPMKKIQLKGLKLPNLKLYYKSKRQGSKLQTGRSLQQSYKK
ncbi:integrase, catalytic region, zinc finger, CCHC-type containing protein [Tanacetum coccineum]